MRPLTARRRTTRGGFCLPLRRFQSRLKKVQKGIFPASLKMILKTHCHLPVRRPAPKTSVQPDDVIGGHRAGENSPQSQCDPSPRCAADDTGSEEPEMPPRSPAVGTESDGPEISRFETSTEEEGLFPLETSMDGFLRPNCTSTEQELFSFFNQTPEWTTRTRQLHNKPPIARCSRDQRRSGSSKG